MSQADKKKAPFPPICLTIGINFESCLRLPDERNCFSDCTLPVRALTVEMKLTHNLVFYCTLGSNTHKVLSGICHSPLSVNNG